MRPTVLFCLLVFGGSLKLHVQCEKIICGNDQYTVRNGSFSYCLNCDTCHPGYGLYPVCGQSVTYPPNGIGCKPCSNGTFSDKLDSAPCYSCQQCAKLEIVTSPCTKISDSICSGTCKKGYFFAKKVPHICQQCSYCCFDGKDEEQPECIKQGLNATGRHCSARLDKQCGPPPSSSTAAVTTQGAAVTHLPSITHSPTLAKLTSLASHSTSPSTAAVTTQGAAVTHLRSTTHSPALAKLTSSTSSTSTNHQVGNHPAVIAPSVLSGLFLAALVVAAILYKRKKQIWRRKRTGGILPGIFRRNADATDRSPAQENYDNNVSQVPQSVAYCAEPRVQALQNTGYAATPEVSPSATPQQTDDEVDELPDVIAVHNKRLLKRQRSKETQNNVPKKDGANESFLDPNVQTANEGFNYKGQDSKGVGQSRSRRHSIEAFKRKLSLSLEKDDYQPLRQEDPDEPQEPIEIEVEPMYPQQKAGSRVEFKCNVPGKKKVFYQWVKDGAKMQGQNNSTLVLDCVEMCDFGCYICHVSFANVDRIKSSPAVLDVTPRDGMDYKCLRQVDDKTQSKVETLLTKKIHGLGGWRQVAIKYDMDEVDRDSLEGSPDAGKTTIGYVKATNPDLTVYEFCKTLKERNIRRFDIIKELLGHLSIPSSQKTT